MARFDVFQGLLQLEGSRTRRGLALLEKEKFKEAKRATGVAETQTQEKIDISKTASEALSNLHDASARMQRAQASIIADQELQALDRQIKNNAALMSTGQLRDVKQKRDTIANMLHSNDPDERDLATRSIIGMRESQDNALILKELGLAFKQQGFQFQQLKQAFIESVAATKQAQTQANFLTENADVILGGVKDPKRTAIDISKRAAEAGGLDPNSIDFKNPDEKSAFWQSIFDKLDALNASLESGSTGAPKRDLP